MNGIPFITQAIVLGLAMLLASCGFVHDETLVSRYRIVAVDLETDLSLCWGLDSGSCETLVGPRLIAAGYNEHYVVAAIHPEKNKSLTEYFYIARDKRWENSDNGSFHVTIKGPFAKDQFEAAARRLRLPGFSWISEDSK